MPHSDIIKTFEKFNQLTILVIGDVMIDAYMWGKVDRISPEAPVPIISVTKRENRLGGAANVALNIKSLGATPVICAMIGEDSKGRVFKSLVKKHGLPEGGIFMSDERKTTIKSRVISDNQHLLRIDEELTTALSLDQEQAFMNHIDEVFNQFKFDAVIFEDYDKGNITPNIIAYVVSKTNALNIPTLVDPKRRNFFDYKNVTVFKPNFKEICEGLNLNLKKGDFASLHQATQTLTEKLKAQHILVTLSELGVFVTEKNLYHQIPAQIRDIADVSGAGDTVVSVAACCLAAGLPIAEVATIANIAGGLVCEKIGVVPINKKQLLDEALLSFSKH